MQQIAEQKKSIYLELLLGNYFTCKNDHQLSLIIITTTEAKQREKTTEMPDDVTTTGHTHTHTHTQAQKYTELLMSSGAGQYSEQEAHDI